MQPLSHEKDTIHASTEVSGCTEVLKASEESGTELVNNQFSICPAWTGLWLCLHSKGMSHKDDRHRTTKTCRLFSNRRAWDILIHGGHRTSMAKENLGFAGTQDEMFTVLLAFWG